MCTKMNKVTVGVVPLLKENEPQDQKRELSSSCIKADSFSTKSPIVRPLHRSTRTANSQCPSTNQVPTTSGTDNTTSPPASTAALSDAENISKGTFTTKSFHLKKSKKPHKIGCKLCDTVCNSNKELTQHHQLKHNILYCDKCSKAFNNPSSLAKHQYSHRELHYKCMDCDEEFAFESKLKAHRISHRTLATHCCAYPNCKKRFKNKGDLTRHVKETQWSSSQMSWLPVQKLGTFAILHLIDLHIPTLRNMYVNYAVKPSGSVPKRDDIWRIRSAQSCWTRLSTNWSWLSGNLYISSSFWSKQFFTQLYYLEKISLDARNHWFIWNWMLLCIIGGNGLLCYVETRTETG